MQPDCEQYSEFDLAGYSLPDILLLLNVANFVERNYLLTFSNLMKICKNREI